MKKLLIVLLIAITLVVTASPVFGKAGLLVTGGGIIIEEHGKDSSKITFAFNVFQDNTGNIEINFHNVNVNSLDKGKFKSTLVTQVWVNPTEPFAIIRAEGLLNGQDKRYVKIKVTDRGEPGTKPGSNGFSDAILILIDDEEIPFDSDPAVVYDTGNDFTREGLLSKRTPLDGGNIQLHR